MYLALVALFLMLILAALIFGFFGDLAASTVYHKVNVLEWDMNNSCSSFANHMQAYQYME